MSLFKGDFEEYFKREPETLRKLGHNFVITTTSTRSKAVYLPELEKLHTFHRETSPITAISANFCPKSRRMSNPFVKMSPGRVKWEHRNHVRTICGRANPCRTLVNLGSWSCTITFKTPSMDNPFVLAACLVWSTDDFSWDLTVKSHKIVLPTDGDKVEVPTSRTPSSFCFTSLGSSTPTSCRWSLPTLHLNPVSHSLGYRPKVSASAQ